MSHNNKYNNYSPYYQSNNDYYSPNINQIEKYGNEYYNESDHSFDSSSMDILKIKNRIDPNILKQYLLFKEFENNEQMEEIKKEKRKLRRCVSTFKKEKEKFNKEKLLFFQSRERVLKDTRKNEEKLLKLEKELKKKYIKRKNELKDMKSRLKQEKIKLENEKKKLKVLLSSQDLNKENEFKNILNNQQNEINNKENHINKLNIEIKQKEKRINELNNKYNKIMKNLNMSENSISSSNDILNKESFPEDTFDDIKDSNNYPENSKENIFDDEYMKTPHDTFIEDDNENIIQNSREYKKDFYDKLNELDKNDYKEINNNNLQSIQKNFFNDINNNNNNKNKRDNYEKNKDNLNNELNSEFNTLNNNINLIKQKTMNYDFNFDSDENISKLNQKDDIVVEEYNSSLGLCKIDHPNYMNAIIQCFAHIPEITEPIINIHNSDLNFKSNLSNFKYSKAYRDLLINLFLPEKVNNNQRKPYNPIKLRNLLYEFEPMYKDNKNVSYVEFVGFLIKKLHDELNISKNEKQNNDIIKNIKEMPEKDVYNDFLEKLNNKNNSYISNCLYGTIKTNYYCHKCQNTFYFFQPYSYFYFNLSDVLEYKKNKYKKESNELNILDCYDYYQRTENLTGDMRFFCPNCKLKNESSSIRNIYTLNNILIITFDYYQQANTNKIIFDYDEKINLTDYIKKQNENENVKEKYFLSGIVNKYEDNYGNENYKAFCKMSKNNVWYCYDDDNVYPIDFKDIQKNGYCIALFYHKLFKK